MLTQGETYKLAFLSKAFNKIYLRLVVIYGQENTLDHLHSTDSNLIN